MHPIDPLSSRPISSSTLGATLSRLSRHLEANRQREQASMELFHAWQERWADQRELIARCLECLDRDLEQLTVSVVPAPHLSLLALSATHDDQREETPVLSDAGATTSASEDRDEDDGIIRSPHNARWQQT